MATKKKASTKTKAKKFNLKALADQVRELARSMVDTLDDEQVLDLKNPYESKEFTKLDKKVAAIMKKVHGSLW